MRGHARVAAEWHLDRLTDEPPRPPSGLDEEDGEEIWIVDRCPLQV